MTDAQNRTEIEIGRTYPMGAHVRDGGVNFTLFSSRAEKIELCLFDGDRETRLTLPGRSGHVYHGFVPGLNADSATATACTAMICPKKACFSTRIKC